MAIKCDIILSLQPAKKNYGTFDINIKISVNGISISRSETGSSQPFGQSSSAKASGRILRPRLQAKVATAPKSNSKPNPTVAKVQSRPVLNLNGAWQKCKRDQRDKYLFNIDDVVMAKLRGHPAWPATVKEIINKNKVKVEFFGAHENEKYGFINITEIIPFVETHDVIVMTLKKNNFQFNKAVREAEFGCGVSSLCGKDQ